MESSESWGQVLSRGHIGRVFHCQRIHKANPENTFMRLLCIAENSWHSKWRDISAANSLLGCSKLVGKKTVPGITWDGLEDSGLQRTSRCCFYPYLSG